MKKEFDFSQGKRGPVLRQKGKTRITIYLDDEVLEAFRERADRAGFGYQTMINQALRSILAKDVGFRIADRDHRTLDDRRSEPYS